MFTTFSPAISRKAATSIRQQIRGRRVGFPPVTHHRERPPSGRGSPGDRDRSRRPSTRSPTSPRTKPDPRNWPPGSAATGRSRTACTGSVMSPTPRTCPRSAPAPARRSWPRCGTWPSACTASRAPPTSPPRYDITPETPSGHSSYSRSSDFADPMDATRLRRDLNSHILTTGKRSLTPATHLMLYRLRTGVAGSKMRCRVEAARDVKLLRPKGLGINLAIAFGRAMAIRRGVARPVAPTPQWSNFTPSGNWTRPSSRSAWWSSSRRAVTRGRRGVAANRAAGEKQAATAPSQGNGKASICKRGEWTS